MSPKISIIVPIYNASKYLKKCLDSILAQSYTDWECILVDDGSTDDSGLICEDYSKLDARFKVIRKDNQGVSAARNTGIKESTGEWLYFCDADDEMLQDGLNILINLTNHGNDIIFGGYVECNEESETIATPLTKIQKELSKEEAIIELYQPSYSNYEGYLWCKLFKANLIKDNGLFFAEDIYYNEDRLFIMNILSHSVNNIIYTSSPVYRYYWHPQSAFGNLEKQWDSRFITDLKACLMMYDCVKEITPSMQPKIFAKEGIRASIKLIRKKIRKSPNGDLTIEEDLANTEKQYSSYKDKILFNFFLRIKQIKVLSFITYNNWRSYRNKKPE